MSYRWLLLFIFTLFFGEISARAAVLEDCESDILKTLSELPPEQVQKYLELQGKLTLHRLAYASVMFEASSENFALQNTIKKLLQEVKNEKDENFLKAKKLFEENELSRTALAAIMPYVTDILNEQARIKDPNMKEDFALGMADLNLLSILAQQETQMKNGKYRHAFTTSGDSSVMNFTKIINSSVKANANITSLKKGMKYEIEKVQKQMDAILAQIDFSSNCEEYMQQCGAVAFHDLVDKNFMKFVKDLDEKVQTENLRFNDFWLHVGVVKDLKKDLEHQIPPPVRAKQEKSLPKIVEEKCTEESKCTEELSEDYYNTLITKVLGKYPYFFTRHSLRAEPELLIEIAAAIDRKADTFMYQGKKYVLPVLANDFPRMSCRTGPCSVVVHRCIKENKWEEEFQSENSNYVEILFELCLMPPDKRPASFIFNNVPYSSVTLERLSPDKAGILQAVSKKPVTADDKSYYAMVSKFSQAEVATINAAAAEREKSYIDPKTAELKFFSGVPVTIGNYLKENKDFVEKLDLSSKVLLAKAQIDGKMVEEVNGQVFVLKSLRPIGVSGMLSELGRLDQTLNVNMNQFDSEYVKNRYYAMKNDQKTFIYKNEKYETYTAQKTSEVKPLDENYVEIGDELNMSKGPSGDKEVIKKYYSQFPHKNPCEHYVVIDKKTNQLEVFKNNGALLWHSEVLLGKEAGDERTLWREKSETKKVTNKKTGAGIYWMNKLKDVSDDDYYQIFKGNILTLFVEDQAFDGKKNYEAVTAIHQVPDGLERRNILFNNKSVKDNRTTDGCVNLTRQDFQKFRDYIGPGCHVLIMPESDQAKFRIEGQQLSMVPTDVANANNRDFYFSRKPYMPEDAKEIQIFTKNEEVAKLELVKKFLETLETEKADIMKNLRITNEDYNILVKAAYAILGAESEFGENIRYDLKENFFQGFIFSTAMQMHMYVPPEKADRAVSGSIEFIKMSKNFLFGTDDDVDASEGPTQIKRVRSDFLNNKYPEINDHNLTIPRHAAIATIAALKSKLKILRDRHARHPLLDEDKAPELIYYLYNGEVGQINAGTATPQYNAKVKKYAKHLEDIKIFEKTSGEEK
ncbi:MAG: L,D-transpeptidase [Bacteriovoracaceae bacterium]|nr:L,D-transpeptidase [Bacteriovoracaceae bacterium]